MDSSKCEARIAVSSLQLFHPFYAAYSNYEATAVALMITMSEDFLLCLCVFIPGKCQNVMALVPAMSLGRSVGLTLPDCKKKGGHFT